MTKRTEATKTAISKKDRREQNRINQQSFRERKRKEFEDLRAELDSIKASQSKTSDDQSFGANIDTNRLGHLARPDTPSGAARFGTPAESKVERRVEPIDEFLSDTTLDPSLLAISAPTNIGPCNAPYPYRSDMSKSNDWDAAFGGPPSTGIDPGYTYVPRHDVGNALHDQPPSFELAGDGILSASYNNSSDTIYAQNVSLSADPLTNITADYMNAQLLAFKSAEWYARAAEVGIKIATTRENAWLGNSTLWPQWSLGDVDRGSSLSDTGGAVGRDCMNTDNSTHVVAPQPTNLSDPWYSMTPQDWQQASFDMRNVAS